MFSRNVPVPCAPFSMLGVPVELATIKFVFRFMVVRIAEMFVWLAYVIVSKRI